MKNVDDLIESAAELAARGLSKGEIADELNVSRETASWLVERSGTTPQPADQQTAQPDNGASGPQDIHVDWSAIGRDSKRMSAIASAMADMLAKHGEDVDLTIGIEKAGGPIATLVARELETDLGTYTPAKHQWEEGDIDDLGGTFSRNFAGIRDRECYVVDDTITSGTTMRETIEAIRAEGGTPLACIVLADKQGLEELAGVPVYSLLQVISVGKDD
ncbi:orotate phosphoribosyltransferase-like protein [Natrinema thermotolerans]|uniref:Transcriptional regulator GfcR n=1 Tax=Natrinema thermotolerans TaxID=121872 RepID=A0AAF0PBB8_9EURY|nr:transcriptional regulator GfcR [Natrinema thermotolerans]QCC60367.1 orotate phosphoribosyltransferase-like protein [Natrinema thermotolerans]QCC61274.1 orotate phosphoribosyltransferase-like protein [Natrinema thermotolerans]WMT07394.1 orotate phosphoribosyltransferase-like protein [Natrinema thermotolerans]WMT08026.1 orotate phosphoribosyltransferase-like protein [Natrinema thermotolerans]